MSKSSIVPVLFSSENNRIVIAGIKKRNTHGAIIKRPSILEKPFSNMLKSPGKTHKNKPVIIKKTIIAIYPVSELKKLLNSFLNNTNIFFVLCKCNNYKCKLKVCIVKSF